MRRIAASLGYAALTVLCIPVSLVAGVVFVAVGAGLTGVVWLATATRRAR